MTTTAITWSQVDALDALDQNRLLARLTIAAPSTVQRALDAVYTEHLNRTGRPHPLSSEAAADDQGQVTP